MKRANFGKYDANKYSPGKGKRNMTGGEANAAKNQLAKMAKNPVGRIANAGKKVIGAVAANKGKAGLALGALAAAGGLGMAGYKAMKKPKSLQDRLKGQASKMFR